MKTIKLKFTGIRPMLMHNGGLADRLNPYAAAIKKITAKKTNRTEEDYAEQDRLEWLGGLYWSDDLNAIALPCDNIEAVLKEGARKVKLGKKFEAAVFLEETEVALDHRKRGKSKEEIHKDPAYTSRVGIVVNNGRVMRIRPMIPTGWSLTFTVEYDASVVDAEQIITAAKEAGALVGIGDWRPKFGRFTVEEVK